MLVADLFDPLEDPRPPSRWWSSALGWITAGVLAAMAWPKLFWWDDPVILLAGIGVATLLAAVSGWAIGAAPGGARLGV